MASGGARGIPAEAVTTFSTLQIDFGQLRVPIADHQERVYLFVATQGYFRRCYAANVEAGEHQRYASAASPRGCWSRQSVGAGGGLPGVPGRGRGGASWSHVILTF